jgi:amidase
MLERYPDFDGIELARMIRAGEVGADEVLESAIARMAEVNPQLNAVILSMADEARQRLSAGLPAGPFTGVPILLKDLISSSAGVPTHHGNRLLRANPLPAMRDSEIVRRLRASGVSILGKTNTPEFGVTPYTEPEAFGPTHNPWRLGHSAGGSSGGSAAAVAAGIVPIATGGDGGGSIRIPASCCGLFGLKPSRGRMPTGPDTGEVLLGLALEHVLTRTVRDSAAMLDLLAGSDLGAPYAAPPAPESWLAELDEPTERLRIAFTEQALLGHGVHPDCIAGVRDVANLLGELGHQVDEDAPAIDADALKLDYVVVFAASIRAEIGELARMLRRPVGRNDFEPLTWALGLLGRAFSAADLAAAIQSLQRATREVAGFFERYDVLLSPTLAAPPPPIGALQPTPGERRQLRLLGLLDSPLALKASRMHEKLAEKVFDFIPFTPLFNVTGQPAMSVPLCTSPDGLPIGMHFAARFGDESTLLRLARELELARPWSHRVPPIG